MKHILSQLGALRTRIRTIVFVYATVLFIAVGGAVVAGSFVMDWLFHLPLAARVVLLCMMLATMGWGFVRFFVRPARVPLSDDALALLVQRRHPEIGDDLINAVQLSRQNAADTGESSDLIEAAVAAAVERLGDVRFRDAVGWRPLKRPAAWAIGSLFIVTCIGFAAPRDLGLWARRVLLLRDTPWPPDTILEVRIANIETLGHEQPSPSLHDVYVPENSPLRVEVRAIGKVPASVRILKYPLPRGPNDRSINIEMPSREGSDTFEYKFGRVTSSFEFCVVGGDDLDEKPYYRVHVRTAPRVNELLLDYDYPDYINAAGQPDRHGVAEYNVVGPVGTKVTMRFATSADLKRFELVFDQKSETPVVLRRSGEGIWSHRFTLEDDHFYTWKLIANNGATSRPAPDFNITAQPDLPPQIGIVLPEAGTQDVSAGATIPIKVVATDDFQMGTVRFSWDTDQQGAFANNVEVTPEDLRAEDEGRELTAYVGVDVNGLSVFEDSKKRAPRPGDTIFVRVEAEDTRSTELSSRPNRATYPSMLIFDVRETVEIERELMRTQIRLKDQVVRTRESIMMRLDEMKSTLDALGPEAKGDANWNDTVNTLIAGQDLVTSSLSETARGFVRVFDGHLFNRMDPSNLTEALIAAIGREHRRRDATEFEVLGEIVPAHLPEADASEAMGKLVHIMNRLLNVSGRLSPAVTRSLKNCLDREETAMRRRGIEEAIKSEEALRAEVDQLMDKMEEWEDFQDVIQSLKDIINLEKGLKSRLEKIAK